MADSVNERDLRTPATTPAPLPTGLTRDERGAIVQTDPSAPLPSGYTRDERGNIVPVPVPPAPGSDRTTRGS